MALQDMAAKWRKDAESYRRLFGGDWVDMLKCAVGPDVMMAIQGQHPALAEAYEECAELMGSRETVAEASHMAALLLSMAHDEVIAARAARSADMQWGQHLSRITVYKLCAHELSQWIKRGGQ